MIFPYNFEQGSIFFIRVLTAISIIISVKKLNIIKSKHDLYLLTNIFPHRNHLQREIQKIQKVQGQKIG